MPDIDVNVFNQKLKLSYKEEEKQRILKAVELLNNHWNKLSNLHGKVSDLKIATLISLELQDSIEDTLKLKDKMKAREVEIELLKKEIDFKKKESDEINKNIKKLDLELNNSEPYSTQHCGDCTACIDACPTQAIVQDGVVDSNKCISYLTIEKRSELNPQEKEMLNDWVFGCDVCQDVCPWNRFSQPHQEPRFTPYFSKNRDINWVEMNEEQFKEIFGESPLTRMGFEKFKQLYLFQQGKA